MCQTLSHVCHLQFFFEVVYPLGLFSVGSLPNTQINLTNRQLNIPYDVLGFIQLSRALKYVIHHRKLFNVALVSFYLIFIVLHKLIFALFLCHRTITHPHQKACFFKKQKRHNKLFPTNVNLKAASSTLEYKKIETWIYSTWLADFSLKKKKSLSKSRRHVLITPCYLAVCRRLQASDKWSGRAFLSYSWHSVIIRGGENTSLNQCVFLTFVNLSGHSERRHKMHNVASAKPAWAKPASDGTDRGCEFCSK